MESSPPTSGALRRLLGKILFTGAGLAAAPASAEVDEEPDVVDAVVDRAGDLVDSAEGGRLVAVLLDELDPFDALRVAAHAALSSRAEVRGALAEAMAWLFPLPAADVLLDHLSTDPDPSVRAAAARAAYARRASVGDEILQRLAGDADPVVARTARLALHGR